LLKSIENENSARLIGYSIFKEQKIWDNKNGLNRGRYPPIVFQVVRIFFISTASRLFLG